MRSIRGLRRAIPSTSPHYAIPFAHRPCRSLTTSPVWRNQNVAPASKDQSKHPDLCSSVTAVMAKLPHPAVVITTLDRTYRAQAAARVPIEKMQHPIACGVTASSFTSLCIRPKPHIMFNMTLPSTMYEALVSCRDFNVHVLTPDTYGARVASVFTRGNRLSVSGLPEDAPDNDADLGVFVGLKEEGLHQVDITNRDAWHEQYHEAKKIGLQYLEMAEEDLQPTAEVNDTSEPQGQAHEVPCLHFRGIMEVLHCRVARTVHPELPSAGENVIVIGEVVGVTLPKECDERPDQIPVALGYADRKYRKISDAINLN